MIGTNRIIINTGILYIKLLIVMALGLVSVRIILGALGETDYGIYSLVAGVVGMLGILNGAMSNASMRFMSHSLGSNDKKLISQTFNTTLLLHFIIGLVIVVIIEIGGFFMFDYLLNIPQEKVFDAKVVFHFMALTTFITIIAVPYDAVINSHENLLFLSLVDIFGAVLKFGGAIYLMYSNLNLLIVYGFLLMAIQILMRIIKQRYSVKHYTECKLDLRNRVDKTLTKKILSFSGWNLFGSLASMSVTQVRSILLNMFFGVNINAANGVAIQVTGQVNAVSSSMTSALNPQLVKTEGGGNRKRMLHLTEMSTKYSAFLFSLFAFPVIIEMPYLFNLWLKEVPDFAVIFARLILISLLIDKFTFEIGTAIRAIGDIKKFQIFESLIAVLNIPLSILVLYLGYPPFYVFFVNILVGIFGAFIRFYFGKTIAKMNIFGFIKNSFLPLFLPFLITLLLVSIPFNFIDQGFMRLSIVSLLSVSSLILFFWIFGISEDEKKKWKLKIASLKGGRK